MSSEVRHPSLRVGVTLALLSLLIALSRLRTCHQPVEWDIGTYAAVAHELNRGERLYADVWDMKPPGIFATYQLAELVAGYGFAQVYLLGVVAAILTMLGIYAAGSAFGVGAGILAAACYALVQGDLGLEANRPNTEAFINACTAWAFALILRAPARRSMAVTALGIGILLGIGSTYKHIALAILGPVIVVGVLLPPAGKSRRESVGAAVLILLTAALWWGVVVEYFAWTGRATIFWNTVWVYPSFYAGSFWHNLAASASFSHLFPKSLLPLLPCAALAIAGLCPGRRQRTRSWVGLAALMLGTQLAIALPGRFFDHYYQLWLVPLTIGAGWGFAAVLATVHRKIAFAASAIVLAMLVYQQVPSYLLPANEWAVRQQGDIFAKWLQPVAHELDAMLGPDETFYQWADEPWLYFATKRRPPAAAMWRMHTVEGPVAEWLTNRTLEDLKRSPPKIIVVWDGSFGPDDHPIKLWVERNYAPQREARHRYPLLFWVRSNTPAAQD